MAASIVPRPLTAASIDASRRVAREMGGLKPGTVALDGTKIHANASRHSALCYEHAGKIEARLQTELMAKAEAADQADVPVP